MTRYLRSAESPRLHLGCGSHPLPGWLNGDLPQPDRRVVPIDATEPLPIADDAFSYIFTEHMLSQLTLTQAAALLRECHRVLKEGGVLRVSTLSLEFLVQLVGAQDDSASHYVQWYEREFLGTRTGSATVVVNDLFYGHAHRFLFSEELLARMLRDSGFTSVKRVAAGKSEHAALRGVERHGMSIPDQFNRMESLILEATKTESVRANE